MSPAQVEDAQFHAAGTQPDPKALASAGLLVSVNAETPSEAVERYKPHPEQAAAAPTREAFAAAGPVIATGHPMLQGIQVSLGSWEAQPSRRSAQG
jgi:hypothetical protein